MMDGQYWHGECAGCRSLGVDCEGAEYSDEPEHYKCYAEYVPEEPDYGYDGKYYAVDAK